MLPFVRFNVMWCDCIIVVRFVLLHQTVFFLVPPGSSFIPNGFFQICWTFFSFYCQMRTSFWIFARTKPTGDHFLMITIIWIWIQSHLYFWMLLLLFINWWWWGGGGGRGLPIEIVHSSIHWFANLLCVCDHIECGRLDWKILEEWFNTNKYFIIIHVDDDTNCILVYARTLID